MPPDLRTTYELGNHNQTTTWLECITFYKDLAARYPHVLHFEQIGLSDSGVPIHAGVVSADGKFSIDLEECQIPLANPGAAEVKGRLTVHSVQIGPGFLLRDLAAILGRATPAQLAQESVVPFQMTQCRVYHRDLTLGYSDVAIRTHGSVGLDQSLSMVAEMTLPSQGQAGSLVSTAMKNQTIQLPIGGTLRQPRIDRTALDQLGRQAVQNAARNVIEDQLNKQLPGLLRPPAKR